MGIYKASSLKELLSKEVLNNVVDDIKDMKIYSIDTSGLSGSKMYKLKINTNDNSKNLYLKVNNLKEDWLARVSNDKGRELTIFKDGIFNKIEEFIKDVYIAYYENSDCYAILMNDMSDFIGSEKNSDDYYAYLDNLAKFHAKFSEHDILRYKSLLSVEDYYYFLTEEKLNQVEEFKEDNCYGWKKLREFLGEDRYKKYCKFENVEDYYYFLTEEKLNQVEEFKEDNCYGWKKLREFLGEDRYKKYCKFENVDQNFSYYPKTFVHGDYRPDNALYIDKDDVRFIDWANSGCGPCTLDLFWYLMSSVDNKVDKIDLIYYYKESLEKNLGYSFTKKTWDTLTRVGVLCACRMFLPALISRSNLNDKFAIYNLQWWLESLIIILDDLKIK